MHCTFNRYNKDLDLDYAARTDLTIIIKGSDLFKCIGRLTCICGRFMWARVLILR